MVHIRTSAPDEVMRQWVSQVLESVSPKGPEPRHYGAVRSAVYWVRHNVKDYKGFMRRYVVEPHKAWLNGRASKYIDILNHVIEQPHGYAGDANLLTKLYGIMEGTHHNLTNWDEYVAAMPEMLSIVERRRIFELYIRRFKQEGLTSLLDLGCGNGEFTLSAKDVMGGRVTGVDNDPLLKRANKRVEWLSLNVAKDFPTDHYDVVYSGGLFDYFSDLMFVRVLKNARQVTPRYIMIGNVEQGEYTKAFLQTLDWHLIDRTWRRLMKLARKEFPENDVEVLTDISGHQHFLVVAL